MSQHLPYITLDSVILDYLNESEQSNNKYFKVWHLAFRSFEDLGIDFFYKVQAFKLPVNANFTVTLPPNYINWTKIGILNDRGEIMPLQYNNKFTTFADLLPTRVAQTQDTQSAWANWNQNTWVNYWNGSGYSNVYGVPSGEPFIGSFKVDTANGVILLNENFNRDYLMVECVVSPQEGQEYYLPLQFRQAVIAWLWWKDKKAVNVARGQVGISAGLKNDYYNERRVAVAKWKTTTISEKYQAAQESSRLAIKT